MIETYEKERENFARRDGDINKKNNSSVKNRALNSRNNISCISGNNSGFNNFGSSINSNFNRTKWNLREGRRGKNRDRFSSNKRRDSSAME